MYSSICYPLLCPFVIIQVRPHSFILTALSYRHLLNQAGEKRSYKQKHIYRVFYILLVFFIPSCGLSLVCFSWLAKVVVYPLPATQHFAFLNWQAAILTQRLLWVNSCVNQRKDWGAIKMNWQKYIFLIYSNLLFMLTLYGFYGDTKQNGPNNGN